MSMAPIALRYESSDAGVTRALGRTLGGLLVAGDFLALCGPLGAGKTTFVKGVALGLGVPADEPIVSPTFVLVREYEGRLRLMHADAYRLGSEEELEDLALAELGGSGVVLLEWADKFAAAVPPDAIRIELAHVDELRRSIEIAHLDAARGKTLHGEAEEIAGLTHIS